MPLRTFGPWTLHPQEFALRCEDHDVRLDRIHSARDLWRCVAEAVGDGMSPDKLAPLVEALQWVYPAATICGLKCPLHRPQQIAAVISAATRVWHKRKIRPTHRYVQTENDRRREARGTLTFPSDTAGKSSLLRDVESVS